MELGKDTILWRIACENTVFDSEGAENLIGRLESVLERLVHAPMEPTIKVTEEGVTVCSLPAFRTVEEIQNKEHASPVNALKTSTVKAWTDTESEIRKILSNVSHVPEQEISKEQTIFNIGLDSISVIKVSALFRNRGMNLSVGEMLKATSITQMASMIDGKVLVTSTDKIDSRSIMVEKLADLPTEKILQEAGFDLLNVEKVLPCGSGQVYMLSTWQNSGGIHFYPTFRYETTEHLEESRLNEAWEILCKQSSILRTAFASTGDRRVPFLQVVLKENKNHVVWLAEPPSRKMANLSINKPLLSLSVLPRISSPIGSRKTEIFLKIHHALYDGVSLDIIIRQLQEFYHNPGANLQTDLHFEDFLAYEMRYSNATKRQNFWSTYLNKSGNFLLPLADFPVQASSYRRKSCFKANLITSIGHLSATAKRHGISIQALFFAAYARVHASVLQHVGTSTNDIILCIYLANRSHPLEGLPTLTSPTMNLVPLCIRNVFHTSLLDSAKTVQRDLHAIGSAENSGVGLWEILDWTGVRVDCFVNFLTLPKSADHHGDAGRRKWVQVHGPDSGSAENLTFPRTSAESNTPESAPSLPNAVAHAYGVSQSFSFPSPLPHFLTIPHRKIPLTRTHTQESVDVEAAIRSGGGGLDVGIWFPERFRGSGDVESVVGELGEVLRELGD